MKPIFYFLISFILLSCEENDDTTPSFLPGKHRITINVDDQEREFYLHIPKNYSKSSLLPVVIMCHGTGGDGLRFYNISGWTKVGDQENIITVFPSSGKYCIIDEGKKELTSKWNAPGSFSFCDGEKPLDDQKFMIDLVAWLDNNFSINKNRVHIVGFSNGGSFSSYVGLTLSSTFASVVSSAGATVQDTIFNVQKKLPVILQVGQSDPKFPGTPFPMNFDQLFIQAPIVQKILNTYISSLNLNRTAKYDGNVDKFVNADYTPLLPSEKHFLRFILVKDLEHNYPNGENHPMKGAEVHWSMIKDISK